VCSPSRRFDKNRSVHVSTMKLRGHEPPIPAAQIQDATARRLQRGEKDKWSDLHCRLTSELSGLRGFSRRSARMMGWAWWCHGRRVWSSEMRPLSPHRLWSMGPSQTKVEIPRPRLNTTSELLFIGSSTMPSSPSKDALLSIR